MSEWFNVHDFVFFTMFGGVFGYFCGWISGYYWRKSE